MPTIQMDVEQVKAVLESMKQDEVTLQDNLQHLKAEVDAITGKEWVGSAVDELSTEYDALHNQMIEKIKELELLAARLGQEIADWVIMATKLS